MIYAIIQARMGSSRLKGKVLMPIGSRAVIQHIVDRLKLSVRIDRICVATSISEQDDILHEYCRNNGIPCFRGSENDVLARYYEAAVDCGAKNGDHIVRITGDCPFIDPEICDKVVELALGTDADYVSNGLEITFPNGVDCEVFRFETLVKMHLEAKYRFEREHVTQYAIRNPDKIDVKSLTSPQNYGSERWTLDNPEDYEFLCHVYDGIGEEYFSMAEIISYLDKNPELRKINSHIRRNEGLLKSIREEGLIE